MSENRTPADKSGHGDKLSRKKEEAITALLTEATLTAAAEKVGTNERTLRRWLNEPDFRGAYAAARCQLMDGAISALQRAASEGVKVLREIAKDEGTKPASRVTAARSLIELALRGTELSDVLQRLDVLEANADTAIPKKGR